MKYNVGVIGATGMVGQRFLLLLENHPWFNVKVLAASGRSAGKTYEEAVGERWRLAAPMPEKFKSFVLKDATEDIDEIAGEVDFVFCAVDMKKDEIRALEENYAKHECPVISNNSANRLVPDVPMIVPEINPEHAEIIPFQKKRLGTKRGFIAVKSNCSLQTYVPALQPLRRFGIDKVLVCTYQAISGAGKTFASWPEMVDNVIPYIGGEEEKSEIEPLKLFGSIRDGAIVPDSDMSFTAQCIRVPVTDGHMGAVFVKFREVPEIDTILELWNNYENEATRMDLPSSPEKFLRYFTEDNRPQTKLDRDNDRGMSVSLGRLRKDTQYDIKFVGMAHNTLRGAAGGAVLMAEYLCAKGYIESK
ncbi:MAG: aspartate-semialdehyde dehydrogenase [Clostridia bacterium]|nr:aspartate-semialdehyde dehydrogenase [Clostridia bacterium]